MHLYAIINAVLLLQLQGFHFALLKTPTDSPGRTIDPSWLRQPKKHDLDLISDNDGVHQDGTGGDISSGEEDDNLNLYPFSTLFPNFLESTVEHQETTVLPDSTVSIALNSSQDANVTDDDSGIKTKNNTLSSNATHHITINSNVLNSTFNETVFNKTSTTPATNSTEEASPDPNVGSELNNNTVDNYNITTKVPRHFSDSTGTTTHKILQNTTNIASTSTTENIMTTTMNELGFAVGNNSDRALATDAKKNRNSVAWGAILGIGLAVCFVAMVVYIILRQRDHRNFMHRKLVEEFPTDPVLRLDNTEPLDLKYNGSAYYNPGLQMDHIQMTNFPRGHEN
ncbi:hypothetical protein UPYG_G00080750 [Umbra pygmaea]|uniref:Mucin-15 n=1 Tax=Umbra pygmaea TaxID=75934 RepID=A0ABD0XT32_UMBPY